MPLVAEEGPSTDPRRGPVAIHDEHLLAQPRFTLTALSPDTLGRGRWSIGTAFLWSNSFSWTQDETGEYPLDRRFLIDGETRTLDLNLARGLTDAVDVGLRLPLRWRGGGVLDGLIDSWHRALHTPDGDHPQFRRNAFRVEGLGTSGLTFSWSDRAGLGLGNLELGARVRLLDRGRDGWSVALAPQISLPTGTGPFDGNGLVFGLEGMAAKRLSRPIDITFGAGITAGGSPSVEGVAYARARAQAFVALEWRPARKWSLVGQTSAATRLVTGIDSYPGLHWTANLSALVDLSPHTRFEMGFTENIKDQRSTPDFGLNLGLVVRR